MPRRTRRRGPRRIARMGTAEGGAVLRHMPARRSRRIGRFRGRPGQLQINSLGTVPPSGFLPRSKLCKLRYVTEITLQPGVGGWASFNFIANGPWDPEAPIGGHSAYQFDDIMRFYRKYRVVGSKIKVFYNHTGTASLKEPAYLTVLKSSSGNAIQAYASASHILESNLRGNVKIVGNSNASVLKGLYAPACTQTYSQRKYFPGIKDLDFEGGWDRNPDHLCYYEVCAFSCSSNNPGFLQFRVEIDYAILFSEVVILSQSGVSSTGLGIGGGAAFGNTGSAGVFAPGDGGDFSSTGPNGSIL